MGSFIEYLVNALLSLLILAMFVNAILSWLIAFDVINMRNRFVYQLSRFLDAVTRPLLRPVLKARVVAPPVEGEANAALIKLIAKTLDIPRSAVRLVAGQTARLKVLEIDGLDEAEVRRRLS